MPAPNPLHPTPSLLAKLGSILIHIEEANSPGGHPFDAHTVATLMEDVEVQDWMRGMADLAMLPVKRVKR